MLLLFALKLNQFLVLLFYEHDDFCAHDNFALPKSIGEKLLDGDLRLVGIEVGQKYFVCVLYEAVVALCLQLESIIRYKLGH